MGRCDIGVALLENADGGPCQLRLAVALTRANEKATRVMSAEADLTPTCRALRPAVSQTLRQVLLRESNCI